MAMGSRKVCGFDKNNKKIKNNTVWILYQTVLKICLILSKVNNNGVKNLHIRPIIHYKMYDRSQYDTQDTKYLGLS